MEWPELQMEAVSASVVDALGQLSKSVAQCWSVDITSECVKQGDVLGQSLLQAFDSS